MLLVLLAVSYLLGYVHTLTIEEHLLREQWEEFKLKHEKAYESHEEDEYRLSVYTDNLDTILHHNKLYEMGLTTYTMGMNQFGDLTEDEYQMFYQMPPTSASEDYGDEFVPGRHHDSNAYPLPKKVDWRLVGAVTEVKNQGKCGSCYAFSAIAALEAQHYLATKQLVSLSEQNIVDCTQGRKYKNKACRGGNVEPSFQYIIDNKGVATQDSYPYKALRQKKCLFAKATVGATMRSFAKIKSGSERDLQEAVARDGPVSVMVDAAGLRFYSGGLYDNPSCSNTTWTHGMTVIGYGTYKNLDYWIVKNSHGIKWGQNGYVLMSRNKWNQCAIASNALYPLVN